MLTARPKPTTPLIWITNLIYFHGSPSSPTRFRLAIENFAMLAGEWVAILGPTGSGKSTLAQNVGLARRPSSVDEFAILEAGGPRDVTQVHDIRSSYKRNRQHEIESHRRRLVGHALQRPELLSALTVAENIAIPLHLNRWPRVWQRVDDLLTVLSTSGNDNELRSKRNHRPHELSGGQQQRVGLARAVAHKPLLLVADEPTSNLDAETAVRAMRFLHQVRERDNTAILFVTHDEALARGFADRIVRMNNGAIVSEEILRPAPSDDFSLDLNSIPTTSTPMHRR